jgi:hypothetical protein
MVHENYQHLVPAIKQPLSSFEKQLEPNNVQPLAQTR